MMKKTDFKKRITSKYSNTYRIRAMFCDSLRDTWLKLQMLTAGNGTWLTLQFAFICNKIILNF